MRAVPPLALATDQVCFIIIKAREFSVKDVATIPDPGSNAADDGMAGVLEDRGDDPVEEEITSFIDAMTVDEQVDLVALAWLGRGDGTLAEWAELRGEAERVHNERTAQYLLGMPLLGDYLEEGLSEFGRSCEDEEIGRL